MSFENRFNGRRRDIGTGEQALPDGPRQEHADVRSAILLRRIVRKVVGSHMKGGVVELPHAHFPQLAPKSREAPPC